MAPAACLPGVGNMVRNTYTDSCVLYSLLVCPFYYSIVVVFPQSAFSTLKVNGSGKGMAVIHVVLSVRFSKFKRRFFLLSAVVHIFNI